MVIALAAVMVISSVEAATVVAEAAEPAQSSTAINPRDLPLLPGEPAVPEPAPAANPRADFGPLAGEGRSHFDPHRSRPVSRSMFTTEYANPDGTHTVKQTTEPQNVQDSSGAWQPVDTGMASDAATGRVRVKRHPLNPSLGMRGDDSALVSVEVEGKRVSLSLEKAAGTAATVSGSRAVYPDVLPDADLTYETTPGTVKETILLKSPPAPGSASWRFQLETVGLTPRLTNGEVELTDTAGKALIGMPPIEAWDSAGTNDRPPAITGGRYQLEQVGGGWVLTISVDETWLRDPRRVYPVSVDPTFSFGFSHTEAYKSDGYWCEYCGARIGNALDNGDAYWRSAIHPDISTLFGKTVVGARLDMFNQRSATTVDKTFNAGMYHASALNFNGIGGFLASAWMGQVGSFSGPSLTAFMRHIVDTRQNNVYFMMVGYEASGVWSYKNMLGTLYVDTGTAPPAATLVGPADNSVITSLTPTLSVNPVTDADGDPVKYCFRVATGADAKTGVVVDSGCLTTPTWTVPAGVLHDGVAYTWQVETYSGVTTTPSPVWHMKVDQRIGERGPSPVDTLGPITVNLANGNVTTSASSPTFTTVGGTAGVTMTYNSQQQEQKGLRASYFVDLSRNGNINPGQEPVLVRTEPQVNVDWVLNSPFPPALEADWFVVRWEGFFQAPVAGTYQFAGRHDDGAKIWINNTKVYDVSGPSDVNWTQTTGVALTAGQRVPIKVELAEKTSNANMRLFVQTTDGTTVPPQIVPADMLFPTDVSPLPKGWTLSADLDGSGGTYTQAKVADQTIVLTDATGAKHTWKKKSTGGYTPPEGEDGILALDTGGRITLTEGDDVYVFRPDGKLETQSNVLDSRKPAALQNLYDGSPSRLREVKDPVSGRSHRLFYNRAGDDCYGGVAPPPGADALPPAQMLCRIVYWDGTETRLWYYQGTLFRIEDPGSEITDYAYNSRGLLYAMRDSLGSDWVAVDPANRVTLESATLINYDSSAKPLATAVTAPAPTPGTPRPQHIYRHNPSGRQTFVDVAGLSPPIGFFSKVTYDAADRLLSTTDATGRVTSQTWSVKDQLLTTGDPAGRGSSTVYDHADRPIDNYGPAPLSCFNGQLPTPECANTVPRTHTNYDEGINGLSAAFYDNKTLTGAPKVYATGIGQADGRIVSTWEYGTAVTPGLTADAFSLRLTGEIAFPAAGNYVLRAYVDDGIRMWVDDQLVMDFWQVSSPAWRQATVASGAAGQIKKIRIDYYDNGGYAKLDLNWTTPTGVQQVVPGSQLRPRYGLTTSTVASESDGVPDQVSATRYNENGLDSTYGLATSTVSGSGGLQLVSGTGYEPPGSGYLRATSKAMPSGARTSYVQYGDSEARANPCVAGSPAVNQGGMAKLTTLPTPATGPARVDEQVYDASGRVVAKSTSGDWSCTSYDARDRVVSQTHPAFAGASARTVTTNYSVGGDPLTTSVSDDRGTVTTQVDLLGRAVAYTDVHGMHTTTSYDQAGRVSSETVTPPDAADPPQTTTYTYDDAGRMLTTKLGSTVLATATYDSAGELATVAYSNGSSLSGIGKDSAGRMTSLTWRISDNVEVISTVARSRAGTVVNETLAGVDARPGAPNYVYDAVGRLTEAWVSGHHYTYDFTSAAPAGCPAGTQANAGLNTNRVRLLDETAAGTVEAGYCYDAADRILATTGADPVTSISYDRHGNTTGYLAGGATTTLGWDGADRNIAARTTGADPAEIAYARDAADRIVRRDASTGDTTATVLYAYSGGGDSADVALAGDKRLATRSISLPGGVLYTLRGEGSAQPSWDHPTIRGDLCLTTDVTGRQAGPLRTYSPFGEPLTPTGTVDPDNVPDNQPGQFDHGWLGQHQRPYEHAGALSLIQMGARPYSPLLGRFLSVDPEEGGSANDYDYTNADPINTTDLDGRAVRCRGWFAWWKCYRSKWKGRAKYRQYYFKYAQNKYFVIMKWRNRTGYGTKILRKTPFGLRIVSGYGCNYARGGKRCWQYGKARTVAKPGCWRAYWLTVGSAFATLGSIRTGNGLGAVGGAITFAYGAASLTRGTIGDSCS